MTSRKYCAPEPVASPALEGRRIEVNCCRNPVCANFGRDAFGQRSSYRIIRNESIYEDYKCICKVCGSSNQLYSPKAIERVVAWTIDNTYPSARCPNGECANHGKFLYDESQSYRFRSLGPSANETRVICLSCKKEFSIGERLGTHRNPRKRNIPPGWFAQDKAGIFYDRMSLFARMVINGLGPEKIRRILQINLPTYYTHLGQIARMFRSASAYAFWHLFREPNDIREISLYSDLAVVSLRRQYDASEELHHKMGVIFTATDYQESYCLLAVTPCFMPLTSEEKLRVNEDVAHARSVSNLSGKPLCELESACFHVGGLHSMMRGRMRVQHTRHPEDLDGFFLQKTYASFGHFYALSKMLRGVGKIVHYLDNERHLHIGCLCAFVDRIRPKHQGDTPECEVFVVSHRKKEKKDAKVKEQSRIRKIWEGIERVAQENEKSREAIVKERMLKAIRCSNLKRKRLAQEEKRNLSQKSQNKQSDTDADAVVSQKAIAGRARGNIRRCIEVLHPAPTSSEPGLAVLWVNWRPGENEEVQLRRYLSGTLKPINTFLNAARDRASAFSRPSVSASRLGHMDYSAAREQPWTVQDELTALAGAWNFCAEYSYPLQNETRAEKMGLVLSVVRDISSVLRFNLPFPEKEPQLRPQDKATLCGT